MNGSVTISRNMLVGHKLTQLRREPLTLGQYRHLMRAISFLLASEVTLSLPAASHVDFEGVGWKAAGVSLGPDPVIIPILRTGLVMADAFQDIMPQSLTGHIGIHREKDSPERRLIEYLVSLPALEDRLVILLDPVIATGDTANRAIEIVKRQGAKDIRFVSLIMSTEARQRLAGPKGRHRDVHFFCAAEDPVVEPATGTVLPGLGSVSQRLFGYRIAQAEV